MAPKPKLPQVISSAPTADPEAAEAARLYRTNDDVGLVHDAAFRGVFYGYLDVANRNGQALALVSVVALGALPAGKRVREFPVAALRPLAVAAKSSSKNSG